MMVPFSTARWTHASHVVLKVTVKGLVLAVFNFQVGEVASAVLGRKGPLFHVNVLLVLLFFLRIQIVAGRIYIIVVLIIKGAIRDII